jgi:hypothetical protein
MQNRLRAVFFRLYLPGACMCVLVRFCPFVSVRKSGAKKSQPLGLAFGECAQRLGAQCAGLRA